MRVHYIIYCYDSGMRAKDRVDLNKYGDIQSAVDKAHKVAQRTNTSIERFILMEHLMTVKYGCIPQYNTRELLIAGMSRWI